MAIKCGNKNFKKKDYNKTTVLKIQVFITTNDDCFFILFRVKVKFNMAVIVVIIWAACYLVLGIILYNLLVYLHHLSTLKNYPKGPFPLPVVGNMFLIDQKKPYLTFIELADVYGDVFSVSLGMERVIVVGTIESLREGMITKAGEFSGRPQNIHTLNLATGNCKDLAMADYGSHWRMMRKLSSKALKTFGDQYSRLEVKVACEGEALSKRLLERQGQAIDLNHEFSKYL